MTAPATPKWGMIDAISKSADAGRVKPHKVAIVVRPNTSKPPVVSRMIGSDRMLTSPEAAAHSSTPKSSATRQERLIYRQRSRP